MALPKFQGDGVSRIMSMMITQWSAQLDPLLAAPLANYVVLDNIKLVVGNNTINHKLGRKLVGYLVISKNAPVDVYDAVSLMPNKTLTLVASAPVTISLLVF